jgi:ribosomal protein S18 acetylase RimI-like enzyme
MDGFYKLKMEIHKATQKDKEILFLFRYLLRKHEYLVEKTEGCDIRRIMGDRKLILEDIKNPQIFFFIVSYKKIPVGYIKLRIKYIFGERMGHCADIFVLEEFRKIGVGRRLMKTAFNFLKKRNIKKISLEVYKKNKLALEAYKKLGFGIVKHNPRSKMSPKKVYRLEKKF